MVWLIVLLTVISCAATFLFSLPDYSNVAKVKYPESKLGVLITEKSTPTTTVLTFPINVNTATKEDLMRVKGIGDVYADRIIAYRDEIGAFSTLEQLTAIKGIGEKRLEAWREYLICE